MSQNASTAQIVPKEGIASSLSFYQRAVLSAFEQMSLGRLVLELPDGSIQAFGAARNSGDSSQSFPPSISAFISVRRTAFFKRCMLFGDVGFAESYMDGDWESNDLTAVVGWFLLNLENAPTLSGSKNKGVALNLLRGMNRLGHMLRSNTKTKSSRNIREHYDLSNDFFRLFLDPTMMYSSAKWSQPDLPLEQAQIEKNDSLCRKLRLKPSDHVLEIGTGWGGWSLHAASTYGCRVTTVTLSEQQYEYARQRVSEAGLEAQVDVRLQDYRDVTGLFDKVVSIEMLEAVGHEFLDTYTGTISKLLRKDGIAALQFITCPDARYDQFRRGVDFIQKHIFPGSLLLSLNRVSNSFQKNGEFLLHHMEDFGRDYARTLRLWYEAFSQRLEEVRELGFDDRFIRKWSYYLCYCEAAFAMRNISVVHVVYSRANNSSL